MGEVATQEQQRQEMVERDRFADISVMDMGGGAAPRMMFTPQSMGEALEVARLMAAGNFVPKHLRGKPGDCLAVVMQAARWAMDPFAVANKTYFVNDRMAYEAQLVNAVINSSGALDGRLHPVWEGHGEKLVCTVTGKLRGDDRPKERRVTMDGLTRNSPLWKQDPEQQLAYYATRAWARLYAPEVLMGVYTPEEVREMGPVDEIDGGAVQSSKVSLGDLRKQAGRVEPEPEPDQSLAVDAEHLKGDLRSAAVQEVVSDGVVQGLSEATAETLAAEPEQGRTDEQHGDQHDGNDDGLSEQDRKDGITVDDDSAERATKRLLGLCVRAANRDQFKTILTRFDRDKPALEHEQIERIAGEIAAARKRLRIPE